MTTVDCTVSDGSGTLFHLDASGRCVLRGGGIVGLAAGAAGALAADGRGVSIGTAYDGSLALLTTRPESSEQSTLLLPFDPTWRGTSVAWAADDRRLVFGLFLGDGTFSGAIGMAGVLMNTHPLPMLALLMAASACDSDSGGGDSADGITPPGSGSPARDFGDIDGIIVRPASGAGGSRGMSALNPRTGETSAVMDVGVSVTEDMVAPSPDGLHFAFMVEQNGEPRLSLAKLGMHGTIPTLVHIGDFSPGAGFHKAAPAFDTSGTWVFTNELAIVVATFELLSCDGAPATHVAPMPDARHILLVCPDGERLYRDGELVWKGAITGRQPHLGQTSATAGPDGDWLDTSFHVPSRTIYRPVTAPPFISGDLTDLGYDLEGRRVYAPVGRVGNFCDATALPPAAQGRRYDLQGIATGTAEFPMKPLELGSGGAFFDIPAGLGLKVTPWGFDADASHFAYGGLVIEAIFDIVTERCREEVRQLRVRRVPVNGGAPQDALIDLTSGSRVRRRGTSASILWSPLPTTVAGPGERRVVCRQRVGRGLRRHPGPPARQHRSVA